MGISGLMAAWALILAFVGGLKLGGAGRSARDAPARRIGSDGGAEPAVLARRDRPGRPPADRPEDPPGRRRRNRIRHDRLGDRASHPLAKATIIVGVAAAALMVSWSARRYEKMRFAPGNPEKTTVL